MNIPFYATEECCLMMFVLCFSVFFVNHLLLSSKMHVG